MLSGLVVIRYLLPKQFIGYGKPLSPSGTNRFDHYFSTLGFYSSNSWWASSSLSSRSV
jgi:hypothetical protein